MTDAPAVYRSRTDAYTVVERLARGGMGTTWKVRRESTGGLCLLKLLHLEEVDRLKALERFEREAEVLRALDHPGIPDYVDVIDAVDAHGDLGIVQEYVPGQTLGGLVASGAPVPSARLRAWLEQLLEVFAYLHGRQPPVVHRDVSPGNVIVDGDRAVLIDFGAVREAVGSAEAVTSVGTFGFMAPEQLMGQAVPASDLFGLGMTFVVLASRRDPADLPVDPATGGVRVREAAPSVPEPALSVLEALVRPGQGERLSDAAAALRWLRTGVAPGAAPAAPARRPPWLRALVVGLLLRLLPVWILLGGWVASRVAPPHQVDSFGGWFSGHGSLLSKVTATYSGDPAAIGSSTWFGPLALDPSGRYLASATDGEALVWDLERGAGYGALGPFGQAKHGADHPGAMALSADGARLLRAGRRWIEVHEVATGRSLLSERLSEAIARDGVAWAAGADADGGLWLLADRGRGPALVAAWPELRAEVLSAAPASPRLGAFSADGRALVLSGQRQLAVWPVGEAAPSWTAALPAEPEGIALDASGGRVAIAVRDGLLLYTPATAASPKRLHTPLDQPYAGDRRPLALAPDGGVVALADDERVRLWDVASGVEREPLAGHDGHTDGLVFVPAPALLVTCGGEGRVRLWEIPPPR